MLCQAYNLECTFVEAPKPRKKAPRNSTIPSAGGGVSPTASSSQRTQDTPGREGRTDIIGHGVYEANDTPEVLWKTLGLQHQHHSRFIGATCGIRPSILNLSNSPHDAMLANESLRNVSLTDTFLIIPDVGTQGYETENNDLDAIQAIVAPHGVSLIDLFFRVIHASYPILHKSFYLDNHGHSYQNFSPSLLASIYLLALRYWSYDAELADLPKPNEIELEQLARKTLLNDFHRPKLSTIAAGLFVLQYSDVGSAELTAQLISLGFRLGIHADASNWEIPAWEIGLRRRLGWALYMQDAWSAQGSGRPRLISATNWSVQPLTHDDFSEDFTHENEQEGSSEVEKGKILFSYMVSLTEILAEVLESMYSMLVERQLRAAGNQGLELMLGKAKPLQIRLKEWYIDLPKSLSMDSTEALKLSSAGSLRLDYLATEATIHRRILTAASQGTPNTQLLEIFRSAASSRFVSAIEFVRALKPQELMSFWYAASKTNLALIGTFGIILCATARDPEERNFFTGKLKEYRWALKVNHVAGAQFMKPAISLLEANMRVLVMSRPQEVQDNDEDREANRLEQMDTFSASQSRSYQAVEEWTMSSGNTPPNDNLSGYDFP